MDKRRHPSDQYHSMAQEQAEAQIATVGDILNDLSRSGDAPAGGLLRLPSRPPRNTPRSSPLPDRSNPASLGCRCGGSGVLLERLETARREHLVVLDVTTIADRQVAQVPCSCAAGQARVKAWRRLPAEAEGVTFSRIRQLPPQSDAVAKAVAFVQQPTGWLTLRGSYGVGKTHLVYATLNALADRGLFGCYVELPTLLDELRTLVAAGGDYRTVLRRLIEAPVLAIDEADKARDTPFTEEVYTALFLARYRERGDVGTVMAFNGDREAHLPPFVVSRMRDERFKFVDLTGPDLRPIAKRLAPDDRGELDDPHGPFGTATEEES